MRKGCKNGEGEIASFGEKNTALHNTSLGGKVISAEISIGGMKVEMHEIPLGFSYALAEHPDAMKAFVGMTAAERSEVIRRAHSVSSRDEMQALVNGLPRMQ